jgi:predicted lipid carrier protein YhbT
MVLSAMHEWVTTAADVLARDAGVQKHPVASATAGVVVQIVAGDLAYHLVVGPGVGLFHGRHDAPTVTIRQRGSVAAAVASGVRSAREAFVAGDLRVTGDVEQLMVLRPLLDHIDATLNTGHGDGGTHA